jgi:hypothetical protein
MYVATNQTADVAQAHSIAIKASWLRHIFNLE